MKTVNSIPFIAIAILLMVNSGCTKVCVTCPEQGGGRGGAEYPCDTCQFFSLLRHLLHQIVIQINLSLLIMKTFDSIPFYTIKKFQNENNENFKVVGNTIINYCTMVVQKRDPVKKTGTNLG
jgi:hypothetical protein